MTRDRHGGRQRSGGRRGAGRGADANRGVRTQDGVSPARRAPATNEKQLASRRRRQESDEARDTSRLAVGIHAVESLLELEAERIVELFVAASRASERVQALVERADAMGVSVQSAEPEALDRLADGLRHQGVIARLKRTRPPDFDELVASLATQPRDVLVLDGVSDPHNLGACLRSAASAGVAGVVVPRSRSAPVTATVRKVASGGAERVPVYAVANLARALRALIDAGLPVVGLAGEGEHTIYGLDFSSPHVLVVGTEDKGLRQLTRTLCDHLVRIPMQGGMESLNMSVATAVTLFEMQRQRLGGGST